MTRPQDQPLPLVLRFTAPGRLMSLNDRRHHQLRARDAKAWRAAAHAAGLKVGRGPKARAVGPAFVDIALPVRDRRARDPHNYVATVKPIVDGLVDAGLWPDDTPEHVATIEPELYVDRAGPVVVTLHPLVCPVCTGRHHGIRCELVRSTLEAREVDA